MSATWHTVALQGRLLVEASAGTGKTWTLAMLYLRLLVEQGLSPQQIVVTTFTEAAAQELRQRIRRRVLDAFGVARGECAGTDPALDEYIAGCGLPPSLLARRLRFAQLELDGAPIGTLHSLCLRVLREFPLHTGSDMLGLQAVDEVALRGGLIDDLWRGLAQAESPADPIDRQLLADGRKDLLKALPALLQPGLQARGPDPSDLAALARLDQPDWAPRLRALAEDATAFARVDSVIRKELRELARLLEARQGGFDLQQSLDNLLDGDADQGRLAKQIRASEKARVLADPTFDFALHIAPIAAGAAALLRGAGLARLRDRYLALRQQRLRQQRAIGYDDMIEGVHAAVVQGNAALAELLFARWPVALIDEFQDTDTRQYAIFDRLMRSPDGTPRGALLMVGDPKQAIYRFRGGDIHTYQRAAAQCGERLPLTRNFRSSVAMVQALNSLYAQAGDGFLIPPDSPHAFGYAPVEASDRCDDLAYRIDGRALGEPLCIHALPTEQDPLRAEARRQLALESCAGMIAEALAGDRHRIGDAPLHAGRIAVLLPRNQDVRALREILRRRGVAATGAGRSDVFRTEWARALQLQLWAWLHPTDGDAARAVLRSPLYAIALEALHPARQDDVFIDAAMQRMAAQAERWRRAGILAAVGGLIDSQTERLLGQPDAAERAITDLRHLGELLAAAEAEGHRDEELWHWLAAQREARGQDIEARQLRIESDADRVQLLTLHAAKGLEFDWVLLPLLWDQGPARVGWPIVVDADSGLRAVDLGSPRLAEARIEAAREDQRERLRLLYVALTRAIHRCDVWAMDPQRKAPRRDAAVARDEPPSALDYLLSSLFEERAQGRSVALPAIGWRDAWPSGDAQQGGSGDASSRWPAWPPLPGAPALESQVSFSSLTHDRRLETAGAQDEIDAVGDPADDAEADGAHPELLAWEPLRGIAVGNALHAIFERRSPQQPLAAQHALIRDCMREFGWDRAHRQPEWIARVGVRLDACLTTPLDDGLCLADLAPAAQRVEMHFRLHLDAVSLLRLQRVLAEHGEASLLPASVVLRELHGLLSGKIDLVFDHGDRLHVLDYKSNRLGLRLADYAPAALERAMDRSGYRFQALLYTLAVHRYLRQRRSHYSAALHLGECWYLFLRGVGLGDGLGIWRHRFAPALVEAVDRVFAGRLAA